MCDKIFRSEDDAEKYFRYVIDMADRTEFLMLNLFSMMSIDRVWLHTDYMEVVLLFDAQ